MAAEEELEKIKNLREKDEEEAVHILLDQQISDSMRKLKYLQDMRKRLDIKNNELNDTMQDIETENDRLSREFVEPPMNIDMRGSFFDQLRNLEAIQEHLRGQVEGLKSVNHSLNSEISKTQNQIRNYNINMETLKEQFLSIDAERVRKSGTLNQARAKLLKLDEELEIVTQECRNIKETVKAKAKELQGTTPGSLSLLVAQKNLLQDEKNEKTDILNQLKRREKDFISKNSADVKIRQKKISLQVSPNVWISQRLSLIAKVKKARDELDLLNNRQKGVNRSNNRNSNIKYENSWTDSDAKLAIACEIADIQKEPPKFLSNAYKTEITFKQEMEKELAEIDRTAEQIALFKATTLELLKEQEIVAAKANRLNLLKKELAELRSKI